MNSLTVNLHLMMASFYRPTPARCRFSSSRRLLLGPSRGREQIAWHGSIPSGADRARAARRRRRPRSTSDRSVSRSRARASRWCCCPACSTCTGELLDFARTPRRRALPAAVVGFDLAHAIGNVPLALHDCGRRFRRVVQLQVPERGPGRRRGLLRARAARAPRTGRASPAGGATIRDALHMGPELRAAARRGRLAAQQSADPVDRAAARLARSLRRSRR